MSFDFNRLTPSEFERIIHDLEIETEKLSEERRNVHFERLMYYDPADLKQAIRILLDTHTYKSFPSVAEFRAALDTIQKKSSAASLDELAERYPCPKCHGGFMEARVIWFGLIYDALVYCDCELGKWRRKQWTKAEGRFGRRKTEAATVFQVRPADHGDWSDVVESYVIQALIKQRPGERARAAVPPAPVGPELQLPTDGPADEEEAPF